jgi:hypothetical protein
MTGVKRSLMLVSVLLAWMTGCRVCAVAQAPLAVTTVTDTVYSASGVPASGTVLVGWAGFTTASGAAVPAGSTSATIGTNGALSLTLAPNAGATPMGSYYTATFHLSDGSTSRQFWVIPTTVPGGGPIRLAMIQNSVLPTSVAMQTVSKAYVDKAIAAAVTGTPADASSPYVQKTGDTMTGPLVLPADPVSPNQAADKNYVDENVTAIASGLGQKVSLLPSTTQAVSQPSGTQLDVNLLNGELYASQYANNSGTNGIASALASPDCAQGCDVKTEPTYGGRDIADVTKMPSNSVVIDQRGGSEARTTLNPMARGTEVSVSTSVSQVETMSAQQLQALRPGAEGVGADSVTLSMSVPTGGSNLFPQNIETPPNAKDTFYELLRGRLAAVNPGRTIVLRGISRPGILVDENEFVTTLPVADCFRLLWTEVSVDPNGTMTTVTMHCLIEYETAGDADNGGMDRGRSLSAMDAELQSALNTEPQSMRKNNYSGFSAGKPAVVMDTNIWWTSPHFSKVEIKKDRITHSARVAVMSYQEGGEL